MMLKIDEVYETTITNLENEGSGVCKIKGVITFVPKALESEKVLVRITDKKKSFARGKLVRVLEENEKRIVPDCPYYNECGGCNLRHQTSEENLKFKKEKVINALKRIGKIDVKVDNVIKSFKENNYRNKASFKVEEDKIGFYEEGTYRLIDIKNCMLLSDKINEALKVIRMYISLNDNKITDITIKYGNAKDELLIIVNSNSNSDIKILNYLKNKLDNLKTLVFNDKIVYGDGYIRELIKDLMFNCSYKSFFQVNSYQVETLYETAIKLAKLNKKDVALDLYCGVGTITCFLSKYISKVIGIEIIDDAAIDAKENAKLNNINNVSFICGDVSKKIDLIKDKIDVIFVDPPRKGLDKKVIGAIKKINPKKIVYISCNPVTMARDLSYLNDLYDVKKVVPVDMFPNTAHVECLCVLKLK